MDRRMTHERRRFFRIDDNVGIHYRPLPEGQVWGDGEPAGEHSDTLTALSECNKKLALMLEQLGAKNELMADIVKTLDQKINCVVRELNLSASMGHRFVHDIRAVNISACGMALRLDEPLSEEMELELELLLLPAQMCLRCHGSVVDASLERDGTYLTRIDFRTMAPRDQELLTQHLVKRQAVLLKERRERRDEH